MFIGAIWLFLIVALQVCDVTALQEQGTNNVTVTIYNPKEFRDALENQTIARIFIAEDLELRSYNGWYNVRLFYGRSSVLYPTRNITIETDPQRDLPATIDLGIAQPLGNLIQPTQVVVELKRLIITNVQPTQSQMLETDLGQSNFIIRDCVIGLKATKDEISDILFFTKLNRQSLSSRTSITTLRPGVCHGGNITFECHDGGWYIDNWYKNFGLGQSEAPEGAIEIHNSLITLETYALGLPSTSSKIADLLKTGQIGYLSIAPFSGSLELSCGDFKDEVNGIVVSANTTIAGHFTEVIKTIMDLNRSADCCSLGMGNQLRLTNLELINGATAGNLTNMVPFFDLLDGSELILENLIIGVERGSLKKYDIDDLLKELKGIADRTELSNEPNITTMTFSDFWKEQNLHWNFREYGGTEGVLVDDLTFSANRANSSQSSKVLNATGILRIRHTLFVLQDEARSKALSSAVLIQRIILGLLAAVIVVVTLVAIFLVGSKRGRRKGFLWLRRSQSETYEMKECMIKEEEEEEARPVSRSADEMLHQEHQAVADKLLEALTLGPIVGRGSFGQVYKATWNGALVAVKVIFHKSSNAQAAENALREAILSSNLRHPNVVQTFHQTTRDVAGGREDEEKAERKNNGYVPINKVADCRTPLLDRSSPPSSSSHIEQARETWLVQEYCDMGSLGRNLELNLLKRGTSVDMDAALQTCADIARGMHYLHGRNVIHGDLKCTNVLLCSSLQDPRGFTAKVADFGLSRELAMDVTHISTNTVGTLTHMPPELLMGRKLSPAADVYSFGIMLWEVVNGRSPFEGWTAPQVLKRVLAENWRPAYGPDVPQGYVQLSHRCWDADPTKRPTFDTVLKHLEALRRLANGKS